MKPECVRYAPMIGSREGELSAQEAEGLRQHLEACETCRAIAADDALTDGLVAEALLARANARDFAPFVDEVMARVGGSARPEPVEGRAGSGWFSWLRRHRRGALATLAPVLAALAVIVYVRLGSGRSEVAMLEVSSEGEATTILETQDGPVVLLSEENGS
jgi:anti-sigma factor RsiW